MAVLGVGFTDPRVQFLTNGGLPNAFGYVVTFAAGSSTLQSTWTDAGLTSANPNSATLASTLILDQYGFCTLYLGPFNYKIAVYDSTGTLLDGYPIDNVPGALWPGLLAGNGSLTPTANASSVANDLNATIQKAASGTHALFAGTRFRIPTIGAGGATLTEASTVVVEGAPAVGSNVYAMHVQAGTTKIDGPLSVTGAATFTGSVNVTATTGPAALSCGRLSLTTAVPITTSDVTGATSIYYTPYLGNAIALYDGTNWQTITFAEVALALGTLTSGLPYDVFGVLSAGALTTEMLAWTNTTTRATALALQNGVYVKSGAATRRYLGTFFTTSTTQTEDSLLKRYVFNATNRVRRPLERIETTANWPGSGTSWRQVNGSSANQVGVLIGLSDIPVHVATYLLAGDGSSITSIGSSIGIDSTSAPAAHQIGMAGRVSLITQTNGMATSTYDGYPGVGQHLLQWLERAGDAANVTFHSASDSAYEQSGMVGWIEG
jgi:hypothetical protein